MIESFGRQRSSVLARPINLMLSTGLNWKLRKVQVRIYFKVQVGMYGKVQVFRFFEVGMYEFSFFRIFRIFSNFFEF